MNRRELLKRAACAVTGSAIAGAAYPVLEAKWCGVSRRAIALPHLPRAFEGKTLALLTDVHHGPFTPREYVRHVVDLTNALRPDFVALAGDYVSNGGRYIAPVFEELGRLRAAIGRYAVIGNHDAWDGLSETYDAMHEAGFVDLTNAGTWIEHRGCRLRLAGVGDLWTQDQDLGAALGDAEEGDATIVLSHNPDFVEAIDDRRVGLVLSGHTHGGQVFVPGYGSPILPSKFGQKYAQGLVQGPTARVYVSRGIGTVGPPVRLFCRPEVVLITLTARA